jgi:hypothetical protein
VASPEEEAINLLAERLGVDMHLTGQSLSVRGRSLTLPPVAGDRLHDRLPSAFPSPAHGDQREKLVYKIVQDAVRTSEPANLDADLAASLDDALGVGTAEGHALLAAAMRDTYWTRVKRVSYLVPYHAVLAGNFAHSAPKRGRPDEFQRQRYKMFTGQILLYLCWRGTEIDAGLADEFLDVFNGRDGFTLLDELLLEAAEKAAGEGAPDTAAFATLREGHGEATDGNLAAGAFCQPALDRFQQDLRALLRLRVKVPRREMLDHLTALLSLHLALLYYRVATVLGESLDLAIASVAGTPSGAKGCDCSGGLAGCSLAGRIQFRIGTRGDRPVRRLDPCATAHQGLDGRRLLGLPAVILTANMAQNLWSQLGGPAGPPAGPRMADLAAEVARDRDLAETIDAAASAWAALYALGPGGVADPVAAAAIGARRPGLFALREAVTAAHRSGLRHTSRDVVNQLAARETGGGLIRRRGSVNFFEMDEEFLFLLVTVLAGDRRLRFDEFLAGLREYGLAPQDEAETERLSLTLERMGMLRRFSDSAEAIYVQHSI